MNRTAHFALYFLTALVATTVHAAPVEIILPAETATLRESTLPGYTLAQQKCSICHSLDYIKFQPPGMNLEQWTAEMKKMQHSYGAPIDEQDIKSIGAYLAVAYGSSKASDATVIAASAPKAPPKATADASAIDVDELLNANACLGCHAIDTKLVGPSFHDVAAKYAGQANAESELSNSIKSGGSGKWGAIPMPPMGSLSDAQAKALAVYILGQ
ncbi:MAG: cytochrome c551/c552 [Bacteroidia bacterium]|jgi:cytochrome c551/c552